MSVAKATVGYNQFQEANGDVINKKRPAIMI